MANIFDKYTEEQLAGAFGLTSELAKKVKAESFRVGELQDAVDGLNGKVSMKEEPLQVFTLSIPPPTPTNQW